jgi:predicted dehydrogenase
VIVSHGRFEGTVNDITITPQRIYRKEFEEKYQSTEVVVKCEPRPSHMEDFLRCVKTREKPVLDALTAYKAQAVISLAVQSYREGRVLFFDERRQKVVRDAPRT